MELKRNDLKRLQIQGTVPTEEYNGADRSPAEPSCDSQTTRERRQSKFAFKGGMDGWMDGKRQLYLISRHIAPSFAGGDKAGQGGGVYKGGSISCDWLDELTPQLTVDIEETSEEETERNFLLLSVAYAANIGGTGVITGSDIAPKLFLECS